jgi:hypothetical protein
LKRIDSALVGVDPPQMMPVIRYSSRPLTRHFSTRTGIAAVSMVAEQISRFENAAVVSVCPQRGRHCGRVEGLVGARRELQHLRCCRRIVGNPLDPVHPLDARAAVPPGNDQADRSAVIGGERRVVHLHGQHGPFEILTREDPAGARDGGR